MTNEANKTKQSRKREIEENLMVKLAIILMFMGFVVMLAEEFKGDTPQIQGTLMGGLLAMLGFTMILAMGMANSVRRIRKIEGKPALVQKSDKGDFAALGAMLLIAILVMATVNKTNGIAHEIYAYLGAVFVMTPLAWMVFRQRNGEKEQHSRKNQREQEIPIEGGGE